MKLMHEIFDEFQKRESVEDKKSVLWYNQSPTLKMLLQGTFHPGVVFFQEDIPPYNIPLDPPGLSLNNLHSQIDKAYLFEVNNPRVPPTLTVKRKKELLIQILESMDAKEAELFIGMLKKDLGVPGLNYALVKEVFPDILP